MPCVCFRFPVCRTIWSARSAPSPPREELRLACAAITLVPLVLLLLGMFGLFIGVVIVFWGVAARSLRLSRESQFLWTLALAVKQNLPLADEVDAFAESLPSRKRGAYYGLSNRLRDGRSLGEALELTSGVLSRPIATELRTAEDSGTLPSVLTDIAARLTSTLSRSQFDSSFAIAILYGWVLLTIEGLIIGFVMYWIIPKYKEIFEDFGVELPRLTVSAINASDLFVGYFYLLISMLEVPILVALALALVYCIGWGNLNYPLLMRWFPRRDAPPLLRSLSHAVETGQPLKEIVEDMAHRHLRSDMRQRLLRISRALELGQPLRDPLCNEGFIRAKEADALAAAQRAGNLPWGLRTLADSMEATSRHRAQFWDGIGQAGPGDLDQPVCRLVRPGHVPTSRQTDLRNRMNDQQDVGLTRCRADRSTQDRLSRHGFTLVEVIIAGSIIGVVFLATIPLLAHVRTVRQEADRRSIAWHEAANVMEQLAAKAQREPLTSAAVTGLTLSPAADRLPDAALEIALDTTPTADAPLSGTRVDVSIGWTTDVGEDAVPVTLSAWLPTKEVD